MISRQRPLGFMVALALTLAVVLGPGFTGAAGAASEDVAMFYDDLSQYGQWVEVEKYGAVWQPTQVPEGLAALYQRPLGAHHRRQCLRVRGTVGLGHLPLRQLDAHRGQRLGLGAGRTWYPATVDWRTSPESEPVDASYVGWAPTPPPDYVPPPSYAPASYYQGSPATDSMSSPLWIFVRRPSFSWVSGSRIAKAILM